MSLINQMLQELDARRSEAAGHGSFGQQVRAVHEDNRLHTVRWVAAGLALVAVSGGVAAWYWFRSPSSVPVTPPASITSLPSPAPVAQTTLPLKFDTGLSPVKPEDRNSVSQIRNGAEPAQESVAGPLLRNGMVQEAGAGTANASASSSQAARHGNGVPAAGSRPSSEPMVAALSDIAKVVPHAKSTAAEASDKTGKQTAPPPLSKHFKELTPQQRAENEYRKGVASLQQGKSSEAVASLEQALQFDPMHMLARQTLIGILLDNKHRDGAMRRAREGLAYDGAQPGLAMILARLQLEKGELPQSIETLERTLPYAADHADYQAFLAALLQRAERHKEAVEHYFIALQKAPQNGVWWMGAGISLQADRRKPEAVEAFKRAKAANTLSPALQEFVDAQLAQLQQR